MHLAMMALATSLYFLRDILSQVYGVELSPETMRAADMLMGTCVYGTVALWKGALSDSLKLRAERKRELASPEAESSPTSSSQRSSSS